VCGNADVFVVALFQQSPQRRWSEAAAREMAACGEAGVVEDGMMRRWSMPWDVRGANSAEQQAPWAARLARDKLCVPGAVLDRSRSTTPGQPPTNAKLQNR